MIEKLVEHRFDDDWSVEVANGEKVAAHDDGAEVRIEKNGPGWLVMVSQPVESDGLRALPITHREAYKDKQKLLAFVENVANATSNGERQIDAFAIVPHIGDFESVDTDYLYDDRTSVDVLEEYGMADVFAVYPNQLPDKMSVEDLVERRQPIIDLVYGDSQEIPDEIRELSNSSEAFGKATIEVFTVAVPWDLTPANDPPTYDDDQDDDGRLVGGINRHIGT